MSFLLAQLCSGPTEIFRQHLTYLEEKKMKKLSVLGGLLFLATSFFGNTQALAHGYPTDAIPAADNFAREGGHFHHVVENRTGYSHLAHDVEHLAEVAEHFHHSVEGGASFLHALRDFRSVRIKYLHVRQAFYQAHNVHHDSHIEADWNKLEHAFDELAATMLP